MSVCWSTFTCSTNSLPKATGNSCPWSIWDWECEMGYKIKAESETCVIDDEPEEPRCWSSYTCGPDSMPKLNSNHCSWSIWDCNCEDGYKVNAGTETCVVDDEPATPKCWSSFTCGSNATPKPEMNDCPWRCVCEQSYKVDAEIKKACTLDDADVSTTTAAPVVTPTAAPVIVPDVSVCGSHL